MRLSDEQRAVLKLPDPIHTEVRLINERSEYDKTTVDTILKQRDLDPDLLTPRHGPQPRKHTYLLAPSTNLRL